MPRIQIGRDAARALKVTAAMRDMRPHELMEELITRHCGQMAMKPDSHKPTEPSLDSEKQTSRKTAPLEENRPKLSALSAQLHRLQDLHVVEERQNGWKWL